MAKTQVQKRIEKLRKAINYHRYLYHVLDRQEISPEALDSLKHELFQLEHRYPDLIVADSPTQRIGGEPLEKFEKVEHKISMLSIEDIFSEEELKDWEKYVVRLSGERKFEYFAELKIDGFAVSLVYRKGMLSVGSTRGNGRVGENVTQNLKTIESIPLRIAPQGNFSNKNIKALAVKALLEGEIEVRGEVYMEKSDFEKMNRERKKRGEEMFSNPRNVAAGSIRQLDPRFTASRPLKFMGYDLVSNLGQALHSEEHEILQALGFKTDKTARICSRVDEIISYWKEIEKKRESLPFLIDGVVVSVDENGLFQKLGVAGKGPRASRALKFSGKQATTRILDIRVQVGRTGAVTPVAILQPVKAGGVSISRATLHNEDEIQRLDVKVGDTVIVERAGDVIPAVVRVLTDLRDGSEKPFRMPSDCPVCAARLVRPQGEAIWRCCAKECPAQKKGFLSHFVSKKAFDMKGIGPKILDRLAEEHLIFTPPDIFELKEGDLTPLERFAEKSASNIISAVGQSKKISLARFLYALGIRHVGEKTAIDLADYFGSIEKLQNASKEELEKIPDIGEVGAESIFHWFQSRENLKLIADLVRAGVEIQNQKSTQSSDWVARSRDQAKFKGRTFVLTGWLDSMTREEAKEKIQMQGGEVTESVSNNTNYVIAGREPGSKLGKAKKLGVKILTEKEFLALF